MWMVTSGYTMGSPYFDDAMKMFESCHRHGISSEIMPYKSFGNWRANANYKGNLVLSALKRHPLVNIVWIDADAVILKRPDLFDDMEYDIAVYFAEWPLGSGQKKCSNGTIFFKNNSRVRAFVAEWARWSMANPGKSQQDKFGEMLQVYKDGTAHGINWGELPPEYCMVVAPDPLHENMKKYIKKPGPIRDDVSIDDVVIMHTWGGARHGGSTGKGVTDGRRKQVRT